MEEIEDAGEDGCHECIGGDRENGDVKIIREMKVINRMDVMEEFITDISIP